MQSVHDGNGRPKEIAFVAIFHRLNRTALFAPGNWQSMRQMLIPMIQQRRQLVRIGDSSRGSERLLQFGHCLTSLLFGEFFVYRVKYPLVFTMFFGGFIAGFEESRRGGESATSFLPQLCEHIRRFDQRNDGWNAYRIRISIPDS